MDVLIKEVMKRTGLPEDKARAAAEAVIDYLAKHLPEPAAGMLSEFRDGIDAAQAEEAKKKVAIAAVAATTAAVNAVVLPGAH